jgi:hypothetical protein
MPARARNRQRGLLAAGLLAGVAALTAPTRALGDGAFPSSQAVLLPRARPREIILGATFGLIFTDDDAATWSYACETDMTRMGRNYVIGPPPDYRIYGVSDQGAPVSSDGACTWSLGGGALTEPDNEALAFDVFPDRANPARVFAIAVPVAPVDPIGSIYRSLDGGLTYEGPIFSPPAMATGTGVEASFSAPQTVYVTWQERAGPHPHLAVSADGGDSWTSSDLLAALGAVTPYLIAVDPTDPRRIFLRLVSPAGGGNPFEALAITEDGGATWSTPLSLAAGSLTGFARLADGQTLFATGIVGGGSRLYRSNDAGRTFTSQPLAFKAGGLSERDGVLFIPTDFAADGFALVSSSDLGETWTPRLRFGEIDGIKSCVRSSCQADCNYLVNLTLFGPATCMAHPDGGSDAGGPPTSDGGCGCRLGGAEIGWLSFVVVAMLLAGRRRIRRASSSTRTRGAKTRPAPARAGTG